MVDIFEFIKNNYLWLLGVLFSWLFTHLYYKKKPGATGRRE